MNFYTHLKTHFKNIEGLKVNIFNDVTTFLLRKKALEEDELILVVKTGVGVTSKLPDLVMTSYPLMITGICDQNNLREVMDKLNAHIRSFNGKYYTTQYDGADVFYNLAFDEASTTSTNQVVMTATGEYDCSIISITGQAIVSEENFAMPKVKIVVNGEEHEVPRVLSINDSYNLSYQSISEQNEPLDDMSYEGSTRNWQISLISKQQSLFNQWLESFIGERQNCKITLKLGLKSHCVVLTNVSESIQNGSLPTRVLNFTEVRDGQGV